MAFNAHATIRAAGNTIAERSTFLPGWRNW
jgi:hypothetical protein